jgi:uncharacterized protein
VRGPGQDSLTETMPSRADTVELSGLRLAAGEGRRLDLEVGLEGFELGGERYLAPATSPVRLDVSRTTGDGYVLRLRFSATLRGPCMRCLTDSSAEFLVDAHEVSQPGEGEELESPYVDDGSRSGTGSELDLSGWAHDALALALPAQILCRPDCAGLCSVCGADLNGTGPEHHHPAVPDPRWAKLSELKFD